MRERYLLNDLDFSKSRFDFIYQPVTGIKFIPRPLQMVHRESATQRHIVFIWRGQAHLASTHLLTHPETHKKVCSALKYKSGLEVKHIISVMVIYRILQKGLVVFKVHPERTIAIHYQFSTMYFSITTVSVSIKIVRKC